jgi:hypothetical protein
MDSYASMPAGSSNTTTTDLEDKWKDFHVSETLSPTSMDSGQASPGGTIRQDSDYNPFDKLKPIQTDITPSADDSQEVVFDSPTSDNDTPINRSS